MKALIKVFAGLAIIFSSTIASAVVLDFDDQNNLGVTLGGWMTWNGIGGGHLYNEGYLDDDSIIFSSDTYVNSFEMNAMPWLGYQGGNIGSVDIAGFNSASQTVWSTTVDLTGYTDWSSWLTVTVETAGINSLLFTAPGAAPHFNGFWPSIDNLVINQQTSPVPEPASIALLSLGLIGLGFSRKKLKA